MTAGTSVLLVLIGGAVVGIAALTTQEPRVVTAIGRETDTAAQAAGTGGAGAAPVDPADLAAVPQETDGGIGDANDATTDTRTTDTGTTDTSTTGAGTTGGRASNEADRNATREPRAANRGHKAEPTAGGVAAPRPSPPASRPAVTSQTETETRDIPYQTQLVPDLAMPPGSRRVRAAGVPGVETLRYLVTYAGGKETGRQLLDSTVTREPQQRVIAVGSDIWSGRDRPRECGPDLGDCLLGRTACLEPAGDPVSPTAAVPPTAPIQTARAQQSAPTQKADGDAVRLGGPLALTDLDGLDGLDPGLVC